MPLNLLYANGRDLAHPYFSPLFGDRPRGSRVHGRPVGRRRSNSRGHDARRLTQSIGLPNIIRTYSLA